MWYPKNTHPLSNLSRQQLHLLNELYQNPGFIIIDTDKNLWPAIMEREVYIKLMLQQHLMNVKNYTSLIRREAFDIMSSFELELSDIIKFDHKNDLTDHEKVFFQRGCETRNRIPQIYGTAKVHKEYTTDVSFRPVNSQCGTLSAVVSIYID